KSVDNRMRRREFISFVAAMAAAWPLVGTCRLTPEEFHTAYPKLRAWIQKTLEFYEKNAKPVASMRFVRLPLYFDPSLLKTTKFIAIDRLPMPPLSASSAGLPSLNKAISAALLI